MNAADLVTDFYASHPAAIRSCIKALETTEEYPSSCLANWTTPTPLNSPSTSSVCSSETQLSTPTHIGSENSCQQPESQDHYRTPSISLTSTPSSIPTSVKNALAPTTASRWHNIQTYLAQDSPHLPSSPLEQKMALPLSEYTQKPTTSTSSSYLSDATTLPSDYTGPIGNQEKKKLSSITTELMSQLTARNRYLVQTSDISATTIADPPSISNPLLRQCYTPGHLAHIFLLFLDQHVLIRSHDRDSHDCLPVQQSHLVGNSIVPSFSTFPIVLFLW